ncbi:MAG: extensin family protein [Deltaproteobacteria bacterium]|nr:extensin family protein [Deltaproteobacteria bacterium]
MTFTLHILTLALLAAPPTPERDPGDPVPPKLPKALVDQPLPWAPIEIASCKERLDKAGLDGAHFRFSRNAWVQSRPARSKETGPLWCHVPQGTVLWVGPTGIRYYGFMHMSCAMTLAMVRFEEVAQAEARRVWGRPETENPIRSITHYGTYNCRWQRFKDKISEHAYGNALDIAGFNITGVWGEVSVYRHWTARWKGAEKHSEFLRGLVQRLREAEVFTNVLDPEWDAGHQNHLHVDMAPITYGQPSPALERVRSMPTDDPGDADAEAGGEPAQ